MTFPEGMARVECETCNGAGKVLKKDKHIKCLDCDGYGLYWVEKKKPNGPE